MICSYCTLFVYAVHNADLTIQIKCRLTGKKQKCWCAFCMFMNTFKYKIKLPQNCTKSRDNANTTGETLSTPKFTINTV